MSGPERVVLLGKKGFIATHLCRHLEERGIPFRAVGKDEIDLTLPAAAAKLGDVVQETDTIVIISALTPDKGRNVQTLMGNLRMAETLCELFEDRTCAHVIYLSSDAVYDGRHVPLDEDSSREPMDLHALMHSAREMMLDSVVKAKGVPGCVLRPVNIYGFGDTHNSYGPNRFVREALGRRTITIFGKGEERRCHLYIEDAARLITLCVESKIVGCLNLAPPETISFMELAETIQAACPFKVELEFKPRPRPTDPIVHRPYAATKLGRTFPGFRFTPLPEAIHRYVSLCQEDLDTGGGRP